MRPFKIGDIQVTSIIEREGPLRPPTIMFPTADRETALRHLREMPHFVWSPTSTLLYNTYQTFVLRTPDRTILIDTCVGENKARPPQFNYAKHAWLNGFQAQGLAFEKIDKVICTHLHVDHCGWNTRLVKERWVPTFPEAQYIFVRSEYEHWAEQMVQGWELPGRIWADSCAPIVGAGQALLVDSDYEVEEGIRLLPSPGHSPGHVCVEVSSRGERAMFVGDLMHHPLQCREPDWSTCFCSDMDLAARSRRRFFEEMADTGIILVPEHFPYPTAGRVFRDGSRFQWKFIE